MGRALNMYVPWMSITVAFPPEASLTVLVLEGASLCPAGGWNCAFQRSRLAWVLPPCPCPKKKMASSASPALPGSENCLTRMELVTSASFHEAGVVDLSPPRSTVTPAAARRVSRVVQVVVAMRPDLVDDPPPRQT